LAKELVELHHGKISVTSTEHQGSTFTIMFPLLKESANTKEGRNEKVTKTFIRSVEQELTEEPSIFNESELTSENTLLLVEDNPDMRAYIRESLAGHYRIIEAVDGQDGVEKALEYIPDIIISDVMMPRKDGLHLVEMLKADERSSHIPIILLTAKADIESRLAGLERGANDYLAKPFHRNELLVRTRNLVDLRKRFWERYSAQQPLLPADNKDIQIEDAFLQKIRAIIDGNLTDSDLEIDKLSHLLGMSRSQMHRKIKALTGQTPSLFIRAIRLKKAKELLETTDMNVSEVAYQVGFSTPNYFSDAFAETYGIRPSQVGK
jgi:DNA-binding response OmpR family regulator